MHANHLSYLETAIDFNLGSNNIVRMWEQIYYEKGPQGLMKEKYTERAETTKNENTRKQSKNNKKRT